jgi:fimbrial chaperone protein
MRCTSHVKAVSVDFFEKGAKPAGPAAFVLLLVLGALFASPAFSSNFRVEPTSLELSGSAKSGAFTVLNDADDKLNVQISAKEWAQDAEGKDVYGEARDVVFFPKIMTVEAHGQRAIRIGIKTPPALQEKTYRLFVEEIPSPNKAPDVKTAGKISGGLTIAFRYSTPIFVKPVRPQESCVIDKIGMSRGAAKAIVTNTGNVHVKLLAVRFTGKAADGKVLYSKEFAGWYLLRGRSRSYEASVPKELCGSLSSIEVKAQSENLTVNGSLNVQKKMCTQ